MNLPQRMIYILMSSVTQVTMTALLTNIEGGHLTALEAKYRRSEKFWYKKVHKAHSSYLTKLKHTRFFTMKIILSNN